MEHALFSLPGAPVSLSCRSHDIDFRGVPHVRVPPFEKTLTALDILHAEDPRRDQGKRAAETTAGLMLPIANTTSLLLGTGTSITQAAMRELADDQRHNDQDVQCEKDQGVVHP